MPETDQLSVSREQLPGSQVAMTIEVASSEVDAAYERVLKKLSQKVKIQGFRPGKAPRSVVEARLGPDAIREEVIEALVPEVVNRALNEGAVDPIDRPRVDILEFERGKPARFTATVSVMPEVELPDLDSLRVEKPHTEVTDAMVDERVQELVEAQATLVPVERPVRAGDVIVGDLEVSTGGVEVPAAARKAMEIEVKEGVLIPELNAAVIGKSVDEAKVGIPASMVDHEVSHQLEELEGRIQRQGLRLDRYFAYQGTTANEWAAKARPDAESRLKVDLVLEKAGKQLQVNPITEEVYAYLLKEAQEDEELKGQVEQLTQNRNAVEYFRHRLTRLQTLEALTRIAAGESSKN